MLVILHVAVAIISMLTVTALASHPTKNRFSLSYLTIAGTLLSGTALVVISSVSLVRSCSIGLVYLLAVSYAVVYSKRKYSETN